MILGIGIDIVEIDRFKGWSHKSSSELSRIFSQREIDYACECPLKSAERFAARFAAKEALYKALSQALGHVPPLLTVFKKVEVLRDPPGFSITDELLQEFTLPVRFHLSLSHSKTAAMATVIIES